MTSPYNSAFSTGAPVRIGDRATLEKFMRSWRPHNPLSPEQLAFADKPARVAQVGYYHGGDVLYTLEDVPGVWHEVCLREATLDHQGPT